MNSFQLKTIVILLPNANLISENFWHGSRNIGVGCDLLTCCRRFYLPAVEYRPNETEVVTYKCCDGWQHRSGEAGCTQREFSTKYTISKKRAPFLFLRLLCVLLSDL